MQPATSIQQRRRSPSPHLPIAPLLAGLFLALSSSAGDLDWPPVAREQKPWAYNWWPGSAVDTNNLARELKRFADAGLGGIHIIPIYGVKGAEARELPYLSTGWVAAATFAMREADRLGLGVDMTLGSGWCFGGPHVTKDDANVVTTDGKTFKPTMKVKRAAPGAEGWMMNPLSARAMENYLKPFTEVFAANPDLRPRAIYHDSYEYKSNWSPDLLDEFEKRRGYKLQDEFGALFVRETNDHVARVKCDYRETLSDLMVEKAWPLWTKWAKERGFLTRNEAHGAPGNWLDLYALGDVSETEMFHTDRNQLVSIFAASGAHQGGHNLVAAETGTWLKEHFQETLGDMKELFDDLFLSGVNHVFYHGTCYSPDDAAWPGWLFYASTEMNPRNAFWRDVPALNAYAARCQSMLQLGSPDPDVLIYWPIYDLWHNAAGLEMNLTVHARDWLEGQPVGQVARQLREAGYTVEFISDRQLAKLKDARAVLVPPCTHMPEATLARLLELRAGGMPVGFVDRLPSEPPGAGRLEERRAAYAKLLAKTKLGPLALATFTKDAKPSPVQFIRRAVADGYVHLVANRGTNAFCGDVDLLRPVKGVALFDPLTGRAGVGEANGSKVALRLAPGESILVRTFTDRKAEGPAWRWPAFAGEPIPLHGTWSVKFIDGGPALPPAFNTGQLVSWTVQGGETERFAGTALYSLRFDAPAQGGTFALDLGTICESARVRLNGEALGTLFMAPYRVNLPALKKTGNMLEVEVTNLSANRIRDLDRSGVQWRIMKDINFVNIDYKPFDASKWPIRDSGLLGPVTLRRLAE